MFKQVFTKLFRNLERGNDSNKCSKQTEPDRYDQPPIYAIPTISSCFQSNNLPPTLTNYYNFNNEFDSSKNKTSCTNNNNNNNTTGINFKSASTLSSSSSTSSSSSSSTTSSHSLNNHFLTNKNAANYNDANTRQIYIAPHCIRYSNSTLDDTVYRIDDESLNEIAAEILESENLPPKLQIVYYDTNYFAINNSHLQIYKQLQLSGLITHVQADLISVEAIPYALRQHLLQTPSHIENSNEITDEEGSEAFENTLDSNAGSTSSSAELSAVDGDANQVADIILPASILDKDILVDETYEFGVCENCLDSDEQDEGENFDENELEGEIGDDELRQKFARKEEKTEISLDKVEKKENQSQLPKSKPDKAFVETKLKSIQNSKKQAIPLSNVIPEVKNNWDLPTTSEIINETLNKDMANFTLEDEENEQFISNNKNNTNESDEPGVSKSIRRVQKLDKKKCLKEAETENLLTNNENENAIAH